MTPFRPIILGLDTGSSCLRTVALLDQTSPIAVDEQSFSNLHAFQRYWSDLKDYAQVAELDDPLIVLETGCRDSDSAGILSWLQAQEQPVIYYRIECFDVDYREDLTRLGVARTHWKAAALALTEAYRWQTPQLARTLLVELDQIQQRVQELKLHASRLLLAQVSAV